MNRRELLTQILIVCAGSTFASVAQALLDGAPLHQPSSSSVFTPPQRALVAVLAERIIPTTDTPGAIAAGVPAFIETIVAEWYGAAERKLFLNGLAACETFCREKFSRATQDCSGEQLDQALRHFESEADVYARARPAGSVFGAADDPDKPFFAKLKELTVWGYYTSEIGAQQELRYDPMPMRYDGDVDLGPEARAWSVGGLAK